MTGILDLAKFAKVITLMERGATIGEKDAAKASATRMAASAGMSLNEALSKLDKPTKAGPKGFFDGFDDWMEEKEPGYKAKEAEKRSDREQRKADRRSAVLARMGSIKAVFDPTELEAALFTAVDPISVCENHADPSNTMRDYAVQLNGSNDFWRIEGMDPLTKVIVERAYPLPETLSGLLAEAKAWETLRHDRQAFVSYEWENTLEARARIVLVEHLLDTRPAASWDDMQARFDWKRFEFERQWIDATERDDPFMERLEADIAILRDLHLRKGDEDASDVVVQFGRRSNADKQKDVLSMLDNCPHLSDREIARRTGVSPQTVNTWRKKAAA